MVGSWTRHTFSSMAIAGALAWTALAAGVATAQDDTAQDEAAQDAAARPRCENVLPMTTRAFASAADTADLMMRWNRTRLGQWISGPMMNPFVEDVYERLQQVWLEGHQRLGIEWSDVRDVPTGQVAFGYVHQPDQRPAIVLWMDIKGNNPAAEALLAKVQKNLIDEGAQREEIESDGVTMVVYTVPPREGSRRNDKAVHFIKDDVLVVAGNVPLAEELIARWDGSENDSLGAQESFRAVMKRCQEAAGEMKPAMRWFVDPFPLIDALKTASPPPEETDTTDEIDMLLALRNQGFDAVTGVGGFLHLDEGPMDVLHLMAIYAPEPRKESMAMLTLPNAPLDELPEWVSDNITNIKLLSVDTKAGFEMMGKFYEELLRPHLGDDNVEGMWEELLLDIKDKDFGLDTDIRAEIVAKLGSRAIILSDYTIPITPESERTLVAIEVTDSKVVANALKKMFGVDETFVGHEVGDAIIWEAIEEEEDGLEADDSVIPPLHFAVAHGYLFVSTNYDIIEETLQNTATGPRLNDAEDFRQVGELLGELGATETCYRSFSRTDEANRVTYELIRENRLYESTSILGRLANLLLENRSEDEPDANVIDGGKLPSYDEARQYVGPSGMFIVTEDEGWYSAGFLLGKGKDAAAADDSAADSAADSDEESSDEVSSDEESSDEEDSNTTDADTEDN